MDAGLTELGARFPQGFLSGILQTHYHADHAQGLLDFRWGIGRLPVYGPPDPEGLDDLYKHPGMLEFAPPPRPFLPFSLKGLRVTPLPLRHSRPTFGYFFESSVLPRRLAYLTDTAGLPDQTLDFLRENPPDALALDCSYPPDEIAPRNHNTLDMALSIIEELAPQEAVLTHIGHELDVWRQKARPLLPANTRWGEEGMILE